MVLGLARDITERKRAEEALRESEEFRSSLLDNAPNPITVINPDTSIRYVNPALEKLTGFTSAEILGAKAPHPWWTEDEHSGSIDEIGENISQGVNGLEKLFQKKNGERFWVEITAVPVTRNGEFQYCLVTWLDITERKRAEEALRESEEFRSSLLDNAPIPIIVLNPDTSIRYVNPALEKLTGYTSAEILGARAPHLWWIADKRSGDTSELIRNMPEEVRGLERLFRKKSGETFWAEVTSMPVRHGRELQYKITTWLDITERKLAEQALRASEQNFRSSLHDSPLGIRIATAEGETLYTNQALLDIYGYNSIQELRATPVIQHYTPESYAEFRERHEKRLRGEPVLPHYEVDIIRENGEPRHLQVSRKEILWDGKPQFQIITQDITERKQMEEKIREAETLKEIEHMRTELLANVSHELRTPLASIKGYATMLLDYDRRLKRDEKRQYLEVIDRATERLVGLVDQLLDMSRLEAGMLAIEKAPTSIRKLLNETMAEARVRSPWHRFILKLPKRLPRVEIDARRIRQVVDNILDNAAKYSEEGTKVVVSVRRVGRELVVSVADQGVGIPADELPRVFDRMYHVALKLKPGAGGVGLGLSICKALVEAHGGRIWIKSKVGKGTKCHFTLPRYTGAGGSNDEKEQR